MSGSRKSIAFSDLRTAAYCPRKLYYRWRAPEADRAPPAEVRERRALAFRYPRLADAGDDHLRSLPLAVDPDEFRENLATARDLDCWPDLVDPDAIAVYLAGKDCHGIAHKLLSDPPRPVLVSAGSPPERGVWEPQSVHAVAAAKALAWERERSVERVVVEFPAHGVVRTVDLTTRRKADYRTALRTARSIDGPPPRLSDRSKCDPCEFSHECGVKTRTMRSMLLGR
jgi:CRISPR-associated exonuclease Cas4